MSTVSGRPLFLPWQGRRPETDSRAALAHADYDWAEGGKALSGQFRSVERQDEQRVRQNVLLCHCWLRLNRMDKCTICHDFMYGVAPQVMGSCVPKARERRNGTDNYSIWQEINEWHQLPTCQPGLLFRLHLGSGRVWKSDFQACSLSPLYSPRKGSIFPS